ncbi:hypothetical protein C8Q73DRAFT_135710 [Cubamyces lactineus]|nr:hypothetical protein C8Q73DRAFT_135710 [Cubamyces lactineus]
MVRGVREMGMVAKRSRWLNGRLATFPLDLNACLAWILPLTDHHYCHSPPGPITLDDPSSHDPPANMPSVADSPSAQALVRKTLKSQEEALLALHKEIAQALALRNTFVPINLLPAEVFVNILTHLKNSPGGPADVVAASHVCRHWRAVAVGTPQLWTVITLANVDLVKEYLERSDPFPLDLSVGKRNSSFSDLATATEGDMHRVESLDAQFQDLEDLDAFASNFIYSAPALRTLRLDFTTAELSGSLEEDFQPPPIIPRLALNVNTVSATNMAFPLFASRTSITTLHLRQKLPDFIPFLKMLTHCPCLQELLIDGEPPLITWDDLSVQLAVDLPLARAITIRVDFMPLALSLLAHLVLPETAAVRMEMHYSRLEDTPPFAVVPMIPCTEKLSRWTIDWISNNEVLVSGWMADSRGPPCVQFTIVARGDEVSFPPLLQCDWPLYICNITDLTLDFRGRPLGSTDIGFLDRYGGWFEGLETLRLRRPTVCAVVCLRNIMYDYITMTHGDEDELAGQEYVEVRFPHLRKVEVSGFVWDGRIYDLLQGLRGDRDDLTRLGHAVACVVEMADIADCPVDDDSSVYLVRARVTEDGLDDVLFAEG